MSNLGSYKTMTTLAKRVGGPRALAAATGLVGYVVLRPAEAAAKPAIQRAARSIKTRFRPHEAQNQVFTVTQDGEDSSGVRLVAGSRYRVLEGDGDTMLIEVIDELDNPYAVAKSFLASVSDYPSPDGESPE